MTPTITTISANNFVRCARCPPRTFFFFAPFAALVPSSFIVGSFDPARWTKCWETQNVSGDCIDQGVEPESSKVRCRITSSYHHIKSVQNNLQTTFLYAFYTTFTIFFSIHYLYLRGRGLSSVALFNIIPPLGDLSFNRSSLLLTNLSRLPSWSRCC